MFQLIITPCGSLQSVSDENLALKFMTTSGDNQFNGYNDNHHIHHSHNHHLHDQRGKNGLRQKSVSAMSSFNQSKFKKDALPSVITNQRKEKFGSSEISKDTVIAKIYDNERLKSNKANTNNNIITNNNNNNNKSVNVKSSAQDETALAKKVETSNIPILTREHKTKFSELKQVKDHSMDKKSIRETSEKINSELNGNQQLDKVKPAVGKKPKESGPLIVVSSINDSTNGKGRKVKIDNKDENNWKQDKELKKEPVNCKEKVDETKKLIKRGPANVSAREIRRTTAKHEQYKNLRGSHRRICLKSSDADSKPYVKAAIDRPKFKRCKSSIPARFKVNIPLQEIERRWKLIKNAERKKSAEQSVKREKQSDENGEPLEFLLLYEINQERKADEYDDAYDAYSYDGNYHVYNDGQDFYSDQETEYEDEADQDLRLSHLLKRTLSEPALLPRDLTV